MSKLKNFYISPASNALIHTVAKIPSIQMIGIACVHAAKVKIHVENVCNPSIGNSYAIKYLCGDE